MDVREFAPALLALSEVCENAHKILTGHEKKVSVFIRSDFKTGSFEFTVLVELWDELKSFFTSDDYATAKELMVTLGLAGGGGGGLIALIKMLRGRKPKNVTYQDDRVRLELEDGNSITVKKKEWEFSLNLLIRAGLKKVVAPLSRDGIDGLEIREAKGKVLEKIDKNEAGYFVVPDSGEVTENESEVLVQPLTIHLEGERKWRFRLGGDSTVISAKMLDEEFARKVEKGEIRFARGDTFRILLRELQWMEGVDVKSQHEVIKVIRHIGNPQRPLLQEEEA